MEPSQLFGFVIKFAFDIFLQTKTLWARIKLKSTKLRNKFEFQGQFELIAIYFLQQAGKQLKKLKNMLKTCNQFLASSVFQFELNQVYIFIAFSQFWCYQVSCLLEPFQLIVHQISSFALGGKQTPYYAVQSIVKSSQIFSELGPDIFRYSPYVNFQAFEPELRPNV